MTERMKSHSTRKLSESTFPKDRSTTSFALNEDSVGEELAEIRHQLRDATNRVNVLSDDLPAILLAGELT